LRYFIVDSTLAVNVEPITDWKEIYIIPIYMGLNREIKPGIGNITDEELQEARRLIRKFPQCPLIKSDVKRPEMLREFVALVEDEFNDVSDDNVNTWLSNFINTEVRLTP